MFKRILMLAVVLTQMAIIAGASAPWPSCGPCSK
jgi:hypothetical protein